MFALQNRKQCAALPLLPITLTAPQEGRRRAGGLCPVPPWGRLSLGTSNRKASGQLLRPSPAPVFTNTMPNNDCPIPPGGETVNTRVWDLFPPPPAVRQGHGMQDGHLGPGTGKCRQRQAGAGRLGLSHHPLPLHGASRGSSAAPASLLPAFRPGDTAAKPAPALGVL